MKPVKTRVITRKRRTVRRGIVEAHIAFAVHNTVSIAAVWFCFNLKKMREAELLKMVRAIEEWTDLPPLQVYEDGTVMILMKDMHLHQSVQTIRNVRRRIAQKIGIKIPYSALTIIDKSDDYESLTKRLKHYLEEAKRKGEGTLCYGTSRYDFCLEGGEESIFTDFFSKKPEVDLYNFYEGVPLTEKVKVLGYKNGILRLKTSLAKAAFLRNEPFTFIRHPLLPDTIKADIVQTIPNRAEVVLTRLRFVDSSPVDRESVRITPKKPLKAMIECPNGKEREGYIHAISVNSVAVRSEGEEWEKECFEANEKHVMISFDLPLKDKEQSHVHISAMLRYKKDRQLIFTIYPNHFLKQQIESYIALQQTRLIAMIQKMVLDFYQGES